MSVHTTGGGGVSLAAFGGGAAVANRLIWTPDGSSLVTGELAKFNGTDFALGNGALVAGTLLKLYQASGGNGINVEAAANNQAANIFARSSDNRLFGMQMYGGTSAGTVGGRNFASLAYLQAVNTAHMLIGPPDFATWVHQGANLAAALGGTVKTLHAAGGNVGGGTDVLQTYSVPSASLVRDGARVQFLAQYNMAANGNTKTPSIQFGGQNIWTPTGTAMNGGGIVVMGWIMRTGAATAQACVVAFVAGGTTPITVGLFAINAITPTWANANALDFLGAGTADNDLTCRALVDVAEAGN